MYVRDTILCKRRADLEVHGLEAVWVQLQVKRKGILVGAFYKPPNSNLDYFDLLKESRQSLSTYIPDIIIMSAFNCNMAQITPNKMNDLILVQPKSTDKREYTLQRTLLISIGYNFSHK